MSKSGEEDMLADVKGEEGFIGWLQDCVRRAFDESKAVSDAYSYGKADSLVLWKVVISAPASARTGGPKTAVVSLSSSAEPEFGSFADGHRALLNHQLWYTPSSHMVLTGKDFVVKSLNEMSKSLGGKIGLRIAELDPPPTEEFMKMLAQVRATNEPIIRLGTAPMRGATGHFMIVRLLITPIRTPDGGIDVATLAMDATRSQVARLMPIAKSVIEERTRLRNVVDALPVGIEILDLPSGRIERNEPLARIWGAPDQDSLPSGIDDFFAWSTKTGELVGGDEWPLMRTLKTGRTISETLEIAKFDGSKGYVIMTTTPIPDNDGGLSGAITTSVDITEVQELRTKALRQASELSRSNDELRHFAHVASHDLRQPLRAISGFLELLQMEYGDSIDEHGRHYVEKAIGGAVRLQEILDDLMTLYKIGIAVNKVEQVDLTVPLKEAIGQLEGAISEAGAVIVTGRMPTVMADKGQMLLMLQNLLENAIKFRGEKNPKIEVACKQEEREWVISVKDNGVGFDPKHATRIFDAFERLHAGSGYSGTGIGLAICKKIAENHAGRIWFQSAPGKGSTFFVALPKPKPAKASTGKSWPTRTAATKAPRAK